jgi:hypothetical protein
MYRNGDFVSEQVYPIVPVQHQSDDYWVYGVENLRTQDDTRRPGSRSNKIDWTLAPVGFKCDGHGLHMPIYDEDRENADAALDLDTDSTIELTDKIFLNREVNCVNSLLANVPTVDLTTLTETFDSATLDPVAFLDQQKEAIANQIGKGPNSFVFSRPAWRAFRSNVNVLKHLFGTSSVGTGKQISIENAMDLLELENISIANSVQITSAENITPLTAQYVWGQFKDSQGNVLPNGAMSLLYYRPKSPGLRTVALGYQFTWQTGRLGSLVFKGRLPDLDHGDYIEVMRYYALQNIAPAAGVVFKRCTLS